MSNFSFQFIGNACGIFTGIDGTKLLCDPWLIDGVFEGSWCHCPPIKTRPADVAHVDAIYLSHIHPDHFDERFFPFDASIPIITLDNQYNFLPRKLESLGFHNLILIRDGEHAVFREFKLQCFAPFAKDAFHDAAIGNIIDSALVVECDELRALNANDNTPTVEAAQRIREDGPVDFAMLNYNAAGPYPSCFNNLSDDEKAREHRRILRRNFDHVLKVIAYLQPSCVLPFAGAYAIGGKESHKNRYLGTTTWDECAEFLRTNLPATTNTRIITLRENDVLNIRTCTANRPYVPINIAETQSYLEGSLSHLPYPYESDIHPDPQVLLNDVQEAAVRMRERWVRFGIQPKTAVFISTPSGEQCIYKGATPRKEGDCRLICSMDSRLLRRILDRTAHWNNAEIGCHINFHRDPNVFEPDLHVGLAFFHL
jgi:UDP-MurNAc hydroxylase